MTHASVAGSPLEVPEALVRLSVGIEARRRPDRGPAPGARRGLSRDPRRPSRPERDRNVGAGRQRDGRDPAGVGCTIRHDCGSRLPPSGPRPIGRSLPSHARPVDRTESTRAGRAGPPDPGDDDERDHLQDHPPAAPRRDEPGSRVPLGRTVRANLSVAELYEDAIRAGEGVVAAEGPLVVRTGKHTGRSPQDKFIVNEPLERREDLVGRRQPAHQRGALRPRCGARLMDYLATARLYVQDLLHRRPPALPALAPGLHGDRLGEHLRAQPVPPPAGRGPRRLRRRTSRSSTSRRSRPTRRRRARGAATVILVHLERMEILIVGTEYAGEIKKSAFTVMNYLLPDEGVLPMHSSVNVGAGGRRGHLLRPLRAPARRPSRPIPQRTPHRRRRARLGRRRRLQLRGRLLRQDDPPVADVRAGHLRHDPPLRDDPRERRSSTRRPASSTSTPSDSPRTPAAPTRSTSSATPIRPGIAGHADERHLPDRRRVRRPAADLAADPRPGAYHFISGYTAKLAGTEIGVKEPHGDVLGLLRGAVHAAPPGRVRRDAGGPARATTTCRSGS